MQDNSPSPRLPLALTMGDPAGIGPDITLQAWAAREEQKLAPFFVLGDPALYQSRAEMLRLDVPVERIENTHAASGIFTTALPVLPVPLDKPAEPGKPDIRNAQAVISSISMGVDLIYKRAAAALVTNPINKHVLYQGGFTHPGHTEFLGHLAEEHGDDAEPVMMLHCAELNTVPVTVHIPLADVPSSLSRDRVETVIRVTADGLRRHFSRQSPRIAVTGLNPHAGEEGALGSEEQSVITPAIKALQDEGLDVTGPWPADTIFQERLRSTYDCVVTMYHDQALIAVKTLAFDSAVNITLGLPFLRTSPDHGTAYDLAGSGKASPMSLISALRVAANTHVAARADA